MAEFKRENKYLVIKWDDIFNYLCYSDRCELEGIINTINYGREKDNKVIDPTFVCIKDTYPEYEYVWKCIEERVTKKEQEQNAN